MKVLDKKIEEVLSIYNTSLNGISEEEAKNRLLKNGKNELKEEKRESVFIKFIEQFKDFTVIILIIAAIISGVVDTLNGHSIINSIVILFVVLANAIIGVVQEVNAEKSLDALKKLTKHTAVVLRNGEVKKILSENVVVGDILLLEAGDYITADARIIEAVNFKVNESQLTGESNSVNKFDTILSSDTALGDRVNMLFTSSLVTTRKSKGYSN